MPIPFLYPESTYAPWLLATRDDTPATESGPELRRPMLPDFTQAELRQMVLEVMG